MQERPNDEAAQIARLVHLRDEVVPLCRQKHSEGRLNFDLFGVSPSARSSCLLGWAIREGGLRNDPAWIHRHHGEWMGTTTYYGITNREATRLFGGTPPDRETDHELTLRARYIDRIIARKTERAGPIEQPEAAHA